MKKMMMKKTLKFGTMIAAFTAMTALSAGCALPRAVKPAPINTVAGGGTKPPVDPKTIAQTVQQLRSVESFNSAQQAKINGLMGYYAGKFSALDANSEAVEEDFDLSLSVTSTGGKTYVYAYFYNSMGMDIQSYMQITEGTSGSDFVLASMPQLNPLISATEPVILHLSLQVNGANKYVLSTPFMDSQVRILKASDLSDAVQFFKDLHRAD